MTSSTDTLLDKLGNWVAARLEAETSGYKPYTPSDPKTLSRILQPGDVLLIEGNQKVSAVIKYLTQSTWSHAAIYIGDIGEQGQMLIEVNLGDGCIAAPLSKYETYNTRICRPVGLTPDDRATLVQFMIDRLGLKYDLKNILDMLRYFFPTPPIPTRWRRRLLAFGSGDPTRAICSTLIAQAFQVIKYPILPETSEVSGHSSAVSAFSKREIFHIRHHSLFTPRDFDISPYFSVVKPTLEYGFDYKKLEWGTRDKTIEP